MDLEIQKLHLNAGLLSGEDATCTGKNVHPDYTAACKAADAHNRWNKRRHDVEPYPCPFCKAWHISGIMDLRVLKSLSDKYLKQQDNIQKY